MPQISIIIPAYNIAPWLGRCLDSVLAQTHRELEAIVVDDGSTDGTAAIADLYAKKDNRVKVIRKENGGVTSARLRGVAEAAGEWIGFVDGDDYVEPNMYGRLLQNALDTGADISHCGYRMIVPSGRVDYYYNTGRKLQQDRVTGLRDLIEGGLVEPGIWNKLYRKALFTDLAGKMDTAIRINEDLLMNYHLFSAANKAVFEDFCPYHYIVRIGSAANAPLSEHKLMDPVRVTLQIMENAEPGIEDACLARLARQLISLSSMSAKEAPELIMPHRAWARKELRKRLPGLVGAKLGLKLKIMLLWTAVWPGSYGLVHRAYAKLTGLDKKYC